MRALEPNALSSRVGTAVQQVASSQRDALVVVRGQPGSGRDTIVATLLGTLGISALRQTPDGLRGAPDPFEPELSGRVPVWDAMGLDVSPEDTKRAAAWLARSVSVAVAMLDAHHDPPDVPGRHRVVIDASPQSHEEREEIWTRALVTTGVARGVVCDAACLLGRRMRAGSGWAWRAARGIRTADVTDAAQLVAAIDVALGELPGPSSMRGIVVERPAVSMDRLILSPQVARALEWVLALSAMDSGSSGRTGVKALFAGASGTGKTLAARALASALGRPLFRVDLANVVSKWVGETEKNLRVALAAAESIGAVLLFDEGDALLAKRGEVQRGADRYANLEVSYLLQALEEHDGVVVVTTNLRSNIDSAFTRRFDACITFGAPGRNERIALWKQELGEAGASLPEEFLVREVSHAELTGGHIAAAARLACALAGRRRELCVSVGDVYTALGSELDKLGAGISAAKWFERAEGKDVRAR